MKAEDRLLALLEDYAPPMLLALSGEPDCAAVYRLEKHRDIMESGTVVLRYNTFQVMLYQTTYDETLAARVIAAARENGMPTSRAGQSFDNGYYIDCIRIEIQEEMIE